MTFPTVYHRLGQLRDTIYGHILAVLSLHKLHYTKLSFYHSILSMEDWIITTQMTSDNAVISDVLHSLKPSFFTPRNPKSLIISILLVSNWPSQMFVMVLKKLGDHFKIFKRIFVSKTNLRSIKLPMQRLWRQETKFMRFSWIVVGHPWGHPEPQGKISRICLNLLMIRDTTPEW